MAVVLHRCKNVWAKFRTHPCWRVQKVLDEAGVEYELALMPWPFGREETIRRTGQRWYPWIEFENGSIYREESKDMVQRIRDGQLQEAPRVQA
jgi:hypothetical protein